MEQSRSRSFDRAQEERRRREREERLKREQAATGPEGRAEVAVERGEIYDQDDQLRQARARAAQQHATRMAGQLAIQASQQQAARAAGQAATRAAVQQQAPQQQP